MEFLTILFLIYIFLGLYVFFFLIILTLKNKEEMLSYPEPNKSYAISIIVPAYNEEKSIEDTIKHVAAFDYPKDKFEIIAINDGSTDNTLKVLKKLSKNIKNLKIIDKKNSGKADSLNEGVRQAKGELVAVVDSDSFPSKESLMKLTGYFDNPEMGAVTSFVSIRNKDESFLTRIQSLEYFILGWNRKIMHLIDAMDVTNGPLSLYRKKYVIEVGGFDKNTLTEDIDLTWNILSHGHKTAMCLSASVTTIAPKNFKAWLRQRVRWGIGGLQAISKYKKDFLKKGMFGIFVIPYVSLGIIMGLFSILLSTYIVGKNLLLWLMTSNYLVSNNLPMFQTQDINLIPSTIFYFFIILFALSLFYFGYILTRLKYDKIFTLKKFFNALFYAIIYLTLYPAIWFYAIYRYIIKDYRW